MESSTIVTAQEYHSGKLHVLVETKHAESFRKFLTEKGAGCGILSEAIFQGTRNYRDNKGQWHQEQQCMVQTFEANCTWKDFRSWTDEWCWRVFFRKPISN
jgi:hypothetical protein